MLQHGAMPIGRRLFLISALAASAAACRPAAPRPTAPTAGALPADFDYWNNEARGMLLDGLETLRAFDDFQAFRVSTATQSSMRQGAELAWDPPTSRAWDRATHITRGLHGRAEQLFKSVTATRIDPSLWREQRTVADAAHDLMDLGEALGAYRNRIDVLPPGDASNALRLLDQTWTQWTITAARWGVTRAEAISCVGATL
jgi:hypothetical protein